MLALVGAEARLAASFARGAKTRRRTVRGDLAVRASRARWTLDGTDCPRTESGEIVDESKLRQCPVRPIDITDYCEVRVGETRGNADDADFFRLTFRRPRPLALSLLARIARTRGPTEPRESTTARAISQTHEGHGFEMMDAKFEAKGDHLFVSNIAPASLGRDKKLFVAGVYSFLSELERHFFPDPGDDEHGVFVDGERVPVFGQWSLEPGAGLRIGDHEWRVEKIEYEEE